MTDVRRLLALPLLALGAILVPAGGVARAEEAVFDSRIGDRPVGTLAVGDTHRYRVPLVTGAELRLRLEWDAGGGGGDDSPSKDEGGPAPALVVLDPDGAELFSGTSARDRVETFLRIAGSGIHAVEVRSGAFAGSYELRIEGDVPRSVSVEVTSGGETVAARLGVPGGATARVTVQRRSGAPPEVVGLRDATGRELGFTVRRAGRSKVELQPVSVPAPGGLDVLVRGRGGAAGVYRVRGRLRDDDDLVPSDGSDDHAERRIVVLLEPGADPAAVASDLGYVLVRVHDGFAVLETPEGREGLEREDARHADDSDARVLLAEPDATIFLPEGSQLNAVVRGSSLGRTDLETQPALDMVRAAPAHAIATGEGVVVAVLDTGVDAAHPFLAGRLLPGTDILGGDADPADESDGLDQDQDGIADEGFGHGTFVAGLVLAAAPDARVLPIRVLDTEGWGTASDVAAGIEAAVAAGADVVNLSLGARGRSEVLSAAVRYAISHGVTVVASTGNAGDTAAIDFPGGVLGVVAVTALDPQGGRAAFANVGPRTSFAAPGVDLVGPFPGEEYAQWTGTSFSAAFGSGAAALLGSRTPGLRPAQVQLRLVRSSRPLGRAVSPALRRVMGGGRLDLLRVVR